MFREERTPHGHATFSSIFVGTTHDFIMMIMVRRRRERVDQNCWTLWMM